MDVSRSLWEARISSWNFLVSACHSDLDSATAFWMESLLKVRRVDEAVERVSSEFVLAGRGGKSSLVLFSY
jgi:hypothetical protein